MDDLSSLFNTDPQQQQYVDPTPYDPEAALKSRQADMLANPARYNPNIAIPDPMPNRNTDQSVWRYDPSGGWGAYASDVGTQFGKDFGPGGAFDNFVGSSVMPILDKVGQAGLAAGAGGIAGMFAGPMLYDSLLGGAATSAIDPGMYDVAAGMVAPADLATMGATSSLGNMDFGAALNGGNSSGGLGSLFDSGSSSFDFSQYAPTNYTGYSAPNSNNYGSLFDGGASSLGTSVSSNGTTGSASSLINETPIATGSTAGATNMSNNVTSTGGAVDFNSPGYNGPGSTMMQQVTPGVVSEPAWYDSLLSKAKTAATDPMNILKVGSSLLNMQQGNAQSKAMQDLASRMEGKSDPFGSQRAGYQNLLSQSYSNPMGSAENQGLMGLYQQAAARKAAANGQRANPIHQNIALSQAMLPQLNAQRQTLAGLSGANQSSTAGMDTYANMALKAMEQGRNANAQPLYALGDIFNPKSKETQQLEALRALLGAKG